MMNFRKYLVFMALLLLMVGCVSVLMYADGTISPIEQNLPENSKMCGQCHDKIYNSFMNNVHARLAQFELKGTSGGCESCHGPGNKHIDSGEKKDIFFFKNKSPEVINAVCMKCHNNDSFSGWAHGAHARNGLACTDCHTIHEGRGKPPKNQLRLCGKCHRDVTSKMYYPSHHPVREGKMECTDCHNPHGVVGESSLLTGERKNELCLKCHTKYQGPFVFEHAPVEEDCTICHDVHGTAANNLLKQNQPFLCLQCHSAHFHTARVGGDEPTTFPNGVSVSNRWGRTGWQRAFGTKCTQCHSQIHGSDLPSQSLPGRGKALTR